MEMKKNRKTHEIYRKKVLFSSTLIRNPNDKLNFAVFYRNCGLSLLHFMTS